MQGMQQSVCHVTPGSSSDCHSHFFQLNRRLDLTGGLLNVRYRSSRMNALANQIDKAEGQLM
jgi:hypothetical protein